MAERKTTLERLIDTVYEPILAQIPSLPERTDWDVVIIGGGVNGLTAAAYLAKAGVKVCVVERRNEIGGGFTTDEILFPGYYSNEHVLYLLMNDYMPALKDFGFDRHGLVFVKPKAQTGMIFGDGKSILLTHTLEDSRDSISKYSFKDARTYGKLMWKWEAMVDEILGPATYVPPTPAMELVTALGKTEAGRDMLDITEKPPLDVINELFESDQLRAIMLYLSCMWGLDPREGGIGFFVPLLMLRGINKHYCVGGSHKFAGALAREIVENGGQIVDMAMVTKIIMEDGHVAGVEIGEEGRVLRSKVVISSLDPHSTFVELLGKQYLSNSLKRAVEGWKYDKWSFYTLHVVSKELPQYVPPCDDRWLNDAFMNIVGFNTSDELLAHWENVMAGKIDDKVVGGHICCESYLDPHLARGTPSKSYYLPFYEGFPANYISQFQIHAPYEIEGGWEKRGKELEEVLLEKWARVAPNMKRENIVMTKFETPLDIETRFPNMRRGAFKVGDYTPTQLGYFRFNNETSSSKTPIDGLYLCGACNYPGGMALGANGYIAANKVAEDMGVKKWWKPTPGMERYIKTYLK